MGVGVGSPYCIVCALGLRWILGIGVRGGMCDCTVPGAVCVELGECTGLECVLSAGLIAASLSGGVALAKATAKVGERDGRDAGLIPSARVGEIEYVSPPTSVGALRWGGLASACVC